MESQSGPGTALYNAVDKLGVHRVLERATGKPCGCRKRAAAIDRAWAVAKRIVGK